MDKEVELETAEEKGIKKGEEETIRKIAKRMKQKNIPLEDISEMTGLNKEEINKL